MFLVKLIFFKESESSSILRFSERDFLDLIRFALELASLKSRLDTANFFSVSRDGSREVMEWSSDFRCSISKSILRRSSSPVLREVFRLSRESSEVS